MKQFISIMLVTGLTAGIFNCAEAQRNRNNGESSHRENRESNVSQQRSNNRNFSETRMNREYNGNRNNSIASASQRNERLFTPGVRDNNRFNRNESVNAVASERYDRDRIYRDNDRYAYNNNRYSNGYYRGGYNRGFVFMTGPRYRIIPRNSISIYFGGYPYYYNDGFFYGQYSGYYEPIFPPVGIRIGFLPFGYSRIFIGASLFYYYNGIYYRQYDHNNYEVVDPPMGATVYSLPQGAKSVILNGEKLYELNGTYYKEDRNSKGEVIYTVVGKNGEINNTDNNNVAVPPPSLQVGDIVNQLPEGSKIVTINGEKMYVTPDGTYLQEESVNGVVQYKVAGK